MGIDVGVNVYKGMLASVEEATKVEVEENVTGVTSPGVRFNNGCDSTFVSTSTVTSCFGLQDPRKINKKKRFSSKLCGKVT